MWTRRFLELCLLAAALQLIVLAGCGSGSSNLSSANPSSSSSPATTTLQAETSNNTSASDNFQAQLNGLPKPGNVSKVDTHTLLYAGSTTNIYAGFMGWFGETGHLDVGYQSNDPQQVNLQIEDMQSRGIIGAILDWFGQTGDTLVNETAQVLRAQAEAHPGFEFAIMEDAGALFTAATENGCDVTSQIIQDLDYINTQFVPSSAYLRVNSRPVIFFFGVDAYYIDWNQVRAQVANNPIFVFRGSTGYTHPDSGGAFQWEDINADPFHPASPNPFDPGLAAQDAFYGTNPNGLYAVGSVYRGFNDSLAAWGIDRYVQPSCGQTWLDTFSEIGKFYSTNSQLPALQIVTWNDYDEGTAVEMGIDNCVYLQPSISGSTLAWNLGGGAESTIDHYTVYSSTDGQNLTKLADVPAGTHSLDLSPFNLTASILYVKATARPGILNKMSPAIAYRAGHQPPSVDLMLTQPSSLTVAASTAGSTDSDGTVVSSTIDFGDGTVLPGPSATHTYTTVGPYIVTATVVDNTGASAVAVQSTSAKATTPGVTIFSPPPSGVVNWPMPSFVASAAGANPITQMSVLLDGTQIYATNMDTIDTALKIYSGSHNLTVQAVDSTGNVSQASVGITAEPGDPAPVPAIQVTPLPQAGANTVLFCGAGWEAPNRFVNAFQWTFSDGSPAEFTPAVVHTFPSPGTFSTTETVINEFGTQGTVTQSVNVMGASATAASAGVYVQDEKTQKQNLPIRLPSSVTAPH